MPRQSKRPTATNYQDYIMDYSGYDFSQFDDGRPQAEQEDPGFFSKAYHSGKAIIEGLGFFPEGVAETAKAAWQGGDIDVTDTAALQEREAREREEQAYLKKYEGKAWDGVSDSMLSIPYSAATMAGTVAGGAAGALAGPVGAAAGGMAASGAIAYRASKHDFLQTMLASASEVLGRTPTQEEWDRIAERFDAEATKYGAWEAGPEALGNLFFAKILGPLGSSIKGGVKGAVKGIAGLYGGEFATETITQMGQGGIESDIGLRDSAPGAWEAFSEVAPATFWQTTLMAGGKKGADMLARRMRTAADDTARGESVPEESADQAALPSAARLALPESPIVMGTEQTGRGPIPMNGNTEDAPTTFSFDDTIPIDLLASPQNTYGVAQGIAGIAALPEGGSGLAAFPEGRGTMPMGMDATGRAPIAPETDFAGIPLATPYTHWPALSQFSGQSAGQGRWGGEQMQQSASAQAIPTQAQLTNTQATPRADTVAQAAALNMPVPHIVPQEMQQSRNQPAVALPQPVMQPAPAPVPQQISTPLQHTQAVGRGDSRSHNAESKRLSEALLTHRTRAEMLDMLPPAERSSIKGKPVKKEEIAEAVRAYRGLAPEGAWVTITDSGHPAAQHIKQDGVWMTATGVPVNDLMCRNSEDLWYAENVANGRTRPDVQDAVNNAAQNLVMQEAGALQPQEDALAAQGAAVGIPQKSSLSAASPVVKSEPQEQVTQSSTQEVDNAGREGRSERGSDAGNKGAALGQRGAGVGQRADGEFQQAPVQERGMQREGEEPLRAVDYQNDGQGGAGYSDQKAAGSVRGDADSGRLEGVASHEFQGQRPAVPGARGHSVAVKVPGKPDLHSGYELVEADTIQASHLPHAGFQKNPRYALENERRYHNETGSRAKVLKNAMQLDPDFLLESVDANHGAPVVDAEGNVLGGNGRAMSIQHAYDGDGKSALAYRGALRTNAVRLGLDPASVDTMTRPVLVRRVAENLSPEDRQSLVTAMNDDFKDSREKRSEGVTRGERLSKKSLHMLAEGMNDVDAGSLREFFDSSASIPLVEQLMVDGVLQETERNALVSPDGTLNPDGKTKVEAALRAFYVSGREALNKLPADIITKMDAALPQILLAANIGGEWTEMLAAVREANDLISAYKASSHKDPSTFLNQVDMLSGKAPTQNASALALGIFDRALGDKKVGFVDRFKRYANGAKLSADNNALAGMGKPHAQICEEEFGVKPPAKLKSTAKEKAVDPAPASVAPKGIAKAAGGNHDARIEDFGEKIGGARKDVWTEWRKDAGNLTKEDMLEKPLEKIFPEPKYDKLLSEGADLKALALVHALRDVVAENKRMLKRRPRMADDVQGLIESAAKILDSQEYYQKFVSGLEANPALRNVLGAASLYEVVGHAKSLAGVRLTSGSYSVYDGKRYDPPKTIWTVEKEAKKSAFSNWPRVFAGGETRGEAIENFKKEYEKLEITKPAKKDVSFVLYNDAGKALEIMIGVKVGRNLVPLAGPFSKAADARSHLADNKEALVEKFNRMKDIPNERRDINNPRVGEDMRGGQDVTPEMFSEAFGFRGVEFGNWVEKNRRQADLNEAYDALMDLAGIIGVAPKALSLNGELGLAFGARGVASKTAGGSVPAAHYEANNVVINLTKKSGAGSLAHEWFHAVDNYFSRMRGEGGEYLSSAPDVGIAAQGGKHDYSDGPLRKEIIDAWAGINRAIHESGLKKRSKTLDTVRSKPYWGTDIELGARGFEAYIVEKLQDNNASNDYLVNIVDEKVWNALSELTGDKKEYPYPTQRELPAIVAAFDNLFQVVEQRETDDGVALASLRDDPRGGSDSAPVSIVDVGPGIVPEFKKIRELAAWLRDYFANQKEAVIASTGKRVLFSNAGLAASIKRSREDSHTRAYAGLNDLVTKAEYDSFEPKDSRHPNLGGQEVYFSAMRMGGKLYAVRLKFDVPSEAEAAVRSKLYGKVGVENLRYKDHTLREIEIAPIAENYGFVGHTATEAIRTITLDVLKGAVKPSVLENGALSSIAPGEFMPSRRNTKSRMQVDEVQRVADAIGKRAKNAATVRVVQGFEELPAGIREKYAANAALLEGVYDPRSRTVWLVSDNLTDAGRAAEVWAHEQLVHHGLRGMFSPADRRILLNQLWLGLGGMGNAGIHEIAGKYGLDPRSDENARMTVMEELIASLAEKKGRDSLTQQEAVWWKRILAAVARAWDKMVQAVSGRSAAMKAGDIDDLLSALGRYVMDGMSAGAHGVNAVTQPAFASVGKKPDEAGRKAWEQVQKDTEAWGRQLDEYAVGSGNKIKPLVVGTTPDVLQRLGAKPLPMEMARYNLAKVLTKHNIPLEALRNLARQLSDPLMVFKSATMADAYVVLTEIELAGENLVAAVHFGVDSGRVRINEIASIHDRSVDRGTEGKTPGWVWVKNQIVVGNLRYYDKTRSPRWFRERSGLQLSSVVNRESYRGTRILTEKDVVKPVPPQGNDAPLASLSPSAIIEAGLRKIVGIAEMPAVQRVVSQKDIGLLKRVCALPHWIAKEFSEFAKVYDRQLQRMDERSAAVKKSLESVPSLFGKDSLKADDMRSLRELLWAHEGKEIGAIHAIEKFLTRETLVSGREMIKVNPAFTAAYAGWLNKQKATPGARKAMLEIRKSLDADLVMAHNRMAAMSELNDDVIKEFRQSIGHVPNYFPHHRYGDYYVQAKVGNEVVFRKHFDAASSASAQVKADKARAEQAIEYPDAVWSWDKNTRMPDEVLGAPIDTKAMEQIIRASAAKIEDGDRADEVADVLLEGISDILKARGWGAHGIKRKGIPGFETEDIARVIYDYKSGLNGWLTKMEASRDFSEALSKIDARKAPKLWEYTSQYVKDMLRNSDNVDRITGNIKSVAFIWYLGGSIKTAIVNATQNIVVGVPRLQMDVTGGGREWISGAQRALVDRVTGNKGKGLTEDEARLVQELYGESVITDAFMEEVRGQLTGVSGATLWNKFAKVLGWPMSEVERFNRASLALAAYRSARSGKLKAHARRKYNVKGKAGYAQAKAFASDVVRDAHFVYGKGNMPEFMRSNTAGRAAASMYTFRTFSHNMINMWIWALTTQGKEGAAFAAKSVSATLALGGLTALPFYATLMVLCQAATGDDDDWTEKIRTWLPQSNLLRDVVCYGIPAIAGVNVGGSLKMETPLTKGFSKGTTPKEILTESIGDIIGIPYDLIVVKPSKMIEASSKGSTWRMLEEAAPVAFKNAMQAWRLYSEGQTTMSGRSINSPGVRGARTLNEAEAVGKLLGFQPVSSTKSYEAYAAGERAKQVRSKMINDLAVLALKTVDTGDPAGRAEMVQELRGWNDRMKAEGKGHMLITFKDVMRSVKSRRRENRLTPKTARRRAAQAEVWGV